MKNKNLSGNLFTNPRAGLVIKETPLSALIASWLDAHRIYNDRLNSGKIITPSRGTIVLCKKGTPDRFAILDGRIVFIEVKQMGKKPTPDQLARHEDLRKAGAIVIVADSLDSFVTQFTSVREILAVK